MKNHEKKCEIFSRDLRVFLAMGAVMEANLPVAFWQKKASQLQLSTLNTDKSGGIEKCFLRIVVFKRRSSRSTLAALNGLTKSAA
jgi:hypothetical protein